MHLMFPPDLDGLPDWKRDQCEPKCKDELIYGSSESKCALFFPPSVLSGRCMFWELLVQAWLVRAPLLDPKCSL